MNFQKIIQNKFFLFVYVLIGTVSTVVSAKDSLYQMLEKMEHCLLVAKSTKSQSDDCMWAEWEDFRDNAKLSLEKFMDIKKYPAHSFDAQIDLYKADLNKCNQLVQHTFFAPIKTTLQLLSHELHALVKLIEPYRGIVRWTKIIAIGAEIIKFEYLLPQEIRKRFLPVLKYRIGMNRR